MRIGTWIGRGLAILLALAVWAELWPNLLIHCDRLRQLGDHLSPAECDALNRDGTWAVCFWLAVTWTPVVLVFVGHGRWRGLWLLGWTWLLLQFILAFTR